MRTEERSSSRPALWLAGFLVGLGCLPAPAGEILIQGFEQAGGMRISGRAARVRGADAVTEGAAALELAPEAAVTVTIPANSIDEVGWLKIDTFEVQPVLASLRLTLKDGPVRTGWVRPGRDTLALPLGLAARTDRGAWPKKPTTLEIRNAGRESVVVDNVRLVPPASPPAGAILLDFGPTDQALWPGFESAGAEGKAVAWSGRSRIYTISSYYPDLLLSDFAGPYPTHRTREALTIRGPKGSGTGWVWLTHYGTQYSPALEYMVRINGRTVLHKRLSPTRMLSAEGLLQGKDEPWTSEWFEQTFVPRIIAGLELPLKSGANTLELANCQVAALAVVRRAGRQAMRAYLRQVQADLKRYRRQFVLARQYRPRCDVPPTDEEAKAGIVFFLPPADEWFNRFYAPEARHRIGSLKLTALAGTTATAAVLAVPCNDGAALQMSLGDLRGPGVGAIAPGAVRVWAMKAVPVVRSGSVYYQPFLPVRSFRNVKARRLYWFFLQVAAPERSRQGTYKGEFRLALGKAAARLPVEVEVLDMAVARTEDQPRTLGVLSGGDCYDVYRSLARVLPGQRQAQITRKIFGDLFSVGFNAGLLAGPTLSSVSTPAPDAMINALRTYPRPRRAGKALVDLHGAVHSLASGNVQPGTALYGAAIHNLVRLSNDLAAKAGLANYALYVAGAGRASGISRATRLAKVFRKAGGRPAVRIRASALAGASSDQRAELFDALDTLVCVPDHKDLGGLRDAFKKTGDQKTLAVGVSYADVYACGFYCWGIGADGLFVNQIFSPRPLFNGFWFDGRSLLVPTARGGFEPTLALLQLGRASEDYALARRCEALVRLAKARRIETQELEKALTEIRLTADSRTPSFDVRRWRSRSVSASQLQEWRVGLFRAAGKISAKLRR